jgi:hypothetical protein
MSNICTSPCKNALKYRDDCYQDASIVEEFSNASASEDEDEPQDIAKFLISKIVNENDDEYVAKLASTKVPSVKASDNEDRGDDESNDDDYDSATDARDIPEVTNAEPSGL